MIFYKQLADQITRNRQNPPEKRRFSGIHCQFDPVENLWRNEEEQGFSVSESCSLKKLLTNHYPQITILVFQGHGFIKERLNIGAGSFAAQGNNNGRDYADDKTRDNFVESGA